MKTLLLGMGPGTAEPRTRSQRFSRAISATDHSPSTGEHRLRLQARERPCRRLVRPRPCSARLLTSRWRVTVDWMSAIGCSRPPTGAVRRAWACERYRQVRIAFSWGHPTALPRAWIADDRTRGALDPQRGND